MNQTPWEAHPTIWKNKTAFMTYLRGCLRKAWTRNPVKLSYIQHMRYRIKNPNPNGRAATVWGFECEMCCKEFVMNECQVDHIVPAGKLNQVEDIPGFIERLLFVTFEDLRLVCKFCNSALAYSDRHGLSFEEAVVEKQVIAFGNIKIPKQIDILRKYGYSESSVSNAKKRKDAYREVLKDARN